MVPHRRMRGSKKQMSPRTKRSTKVELVELFVTLLSPFCMLVIKGFLT